jgi:hypothetical protein
MGSTEKKNPAVWREFYFKKYPAKVDASIQGKAICFDLSKFGVCSWRRDAFWTANQML